MASGLEPGRDMDWSLGFPAAGTRGTRESAFTVALIQEPGVWLTAPGFRMSKRRVEEILEMLPLIVSRSEILGQGIFFFNNPPTLLICFAFLFQFLMGGY